MSRPCRVALLFLLAGAAAARAGENANLAAAELLQGAAPAIVGTLQARFPDDYAALLPDAAGLAMLPGTGATAAEVRTQAGVLVARAVAAIERRDAGFVLRAPTASLRPVIAADHDLLRAARDSSPALCPVLLGGQDGTIPVDALATPLAARTAALLTAIADGRDHPVPGRRADPHDYQAFTDAARRDGVDTGAWAVLAPDRIGSAPPADVCTALIAVDATLLAREDTLADRILADLAAVLTHQGN